MTIEWGEKREKEKSRQEVSPKEPMKPLWLGCIGRRHVLQPSFNSCFLIFLTDAIGFYCRWLAAFGVIMTVLEFGMQLMTQ